MYEATISPNASPDVEVDEPALPLEEIMLPKTPVWTTKKIRVRVTKAKPEASVVDNGQCLALYFDYNGQIPNGIILPSKLEISPTIGVKYADNVRAINELYGQIERRLSHGYCEIELELEKVPCYVRGSVDDPNFSLRHTIKRGINDVLTIRSQTAETNLSSFNEPSYLERT